MAKTATLTVQQWGNSLAVRIRAALARWHERPDPLPRAGGKVILPSGETSPSPELLAHILELAGTGMILVGAPGRGQALAFWVAYYHVPAPAIAVTKDADFVWDPVWTSNR